MGKTDLVSQLKSFITVTSIVFGISQGLAWIASPSGNYSLHFVALLDIAVQWLVFLIHGSGLLGNERSEKYYDLSGAITFFSSILLSYTLNGGFAALSIRQNLLNLFVIIWCKKLGGYLFHRILHEGGNNYRDRRFDRIRPSFFLYMNFWTIQALWVFLTAFPVYVVNTTTKLQSPLNLIDYIGIFIWFFGISIETLADYQKYRFKSNSHNQGKYIKTNLWSLSRHPNYFGEITLWIGIFIIATQGFNRYQQYISILSPIFVAYLLIKISGIPLLEKSADEKWGTQSDYIEYKKTVPVLIPIFGRTGNAAF